MVSRGDESKVIFSPANKIKIQMKRKLHHHHELYVSIVYHEAQQFNHFSPNYDENNFNPNEFRLNVQIRSDRSENIALPPSMDLKFSVSIDSNRRDVNRDYIVEYVSDLKGFRIKVETAQRGLEPVLRGFGGGGYGGDGGALSADVLKSGAG
uniref:Uncharacterized protein n=1 Tax=Glossina palpalis gambiensis TaxID=67801 RepID=A0A1B0AY27_9MUSC